MVGDNKQIKQIKLTPKMIRKKERNQTIPSNKRNYRVCGLFDGKKQWQVIDGK